MSWGNNKHNNKQMSDTYNYNSGSPFGGLGGLFGGGFGGCNNWMDLIALIVVGGLFGFGGFGGFGGRAGGQLGADAYAATTAAMISQQTTADRVAAIGADVRQVLGQTGGIIEAVNTVGNRTQDGFARVDTNMCQLGNNIAMQAVNNHNNLTSQLTDIRFDAQKCCCETQNLLNSKFCELGYRMQADKCDLQRAIAYEGETTRSMIKDIQTQQLQERLAKAEAQLSQNAQTAAIVSAVQANCSPCAPKCGCGCGNGYAYGFNPAGKCGDLLCSVQNAFADEIAQRIINPTTAATAA